MSVKELRLKKGWSQEELAGLANLSTRTIQRIEKENSGSRESLKALAEVFDLNMQELLEEKTGNEKKPEDKLASTIFQDKGIVVYVLVNLTLFSINIYTSEHMWFIYPLIGWGIPLVYRRVKRKMLLVP